ncbi:MAG: sulfurtransferase [Xanthomonadales bacterium]|nr:sulfurtransferase [Xanthomonadales bacterium]
MLDHLRRAVNKTLNAPDKAPEDDTLPVLDHHQARTAQKDGATMIDVREPDEWADGHIAGARLHPLPRIASDPDLDLALGTPVITYCKVGARAERAAEILHAAGYADVQIMTGGFADWQDAGYPVE